MALLLIMDGFWYNIIWGAEMEEIKNLREKRKERGKKIKKVASLGYIFHYISDAAAPWGL